LARVRRWSSSVSDCSWLADRASDARISYEGYLDEWREILLLGPRPWPGGPTRRPGELKRITTGLRSMAGPLDELAIELALAGTVSHLHCQPSTPSAIYTITRNETSWILASTPCINGNSALPVITPA
jgi:hypothetical protein